MSIATIPHRSSPPALLLRASSRDGGQGKTRTLATLTPWPPVQSAAWRRVLRGDTLVPPGDAFESVRRLPHGHMAAVLGTVRRLGGEALLAARKSRPRALVLALLVARRIDPQSKLATARSLGTDPALPSLGQTLGVEAADARELYTALDWLRRRQPRLEAALAQRHLTEGTLALYDVTATSFEGHTGPLARVGQARAGKKGTVQMGCGLVCTAAGCPVAVAVCAGHTSDPATLASLLQKLQRRFPLPRLVVVGDRGLLTDARLRQEVQPVAGLDWSPALRGPTIRPLVETGSLELTRLAQTDRVELTDPAYPDERLIACRNPCVAEERARKREALLQATERELAAIRQAPQRVKRRLTGQEQSALRVGQVRKRCQRGKHFALEIPAEGVQYTRDGQRLAAEAALDGVSVLRTSVPLETLDTASTVRAYKSLATVERAFRSVKTGDLHGRPIGPRVAERVRAPVCLGMVA